MTTRVLGLLACAAIAGAGCESRAASAPAAQPPSGEVGMTVAQVRDARVAVEPVRERLVGSEIETW